MSLRDLWEERIRPLTEDSSWLLDAAARCFEGAALLHGQLARKRVPEDFVQPLRQVGVRLFSCGDELRSASRPTVSLLDRLMIRLFDPIRALRFALIDPAPDTQAELTHLLEELEGLQVEAQAVRRGLQLMGGLS
jgi:hypothetical protein